MRNVAEQWCFSNGEKGRNIVEQWCFGNGEKGKILLNSGVSAMGKMGKMRKMLLKSGLKKEGAVLHKMKLGSS
jgi:hypothetical protein